MIGQAKTDCRYYEGTETRAGCSAPICPRDPESMEYCAFFPGEDICILREVPLWVKRQRRIAAVTKGDPGVGCFTVAMLAHPCVIKAGIRGLDPETEITPRRVREWIAARPERRHYTDAERSAIGARLGKKGASDRARTRPEGQHAAAEDGPAPEVVSGILRDGEGDESA